MKTKLMILMMGLLTASASFADCVNYAGVYLKHGEQLSNQPDFIIITQVGCDSVKVGKSKNPLNVTGQTYEFLPTPLTISVADVVTPFGTVSQSMTSVWTPEYLACMSAGIVVSTGSAGGGIDVFTKTFDGNLKYSDGHTTEIYDRF